MKRWALHEEKAIRSLALVAAFLLCGTGFGQTAEKIDLDLDAALALAQKANPDLVNAAIALESTFREYSARMGVFMPSLSARISFGAASELLLKGEQSSAPGASDPTSMSVNLGLSLPLGSDLAFDVRQKVADLKIQELAFSMLKAQVRRDTRKAYFSLIKAGEDLELRKRSFKQANDRFGRTKVKYEQGLSSELEYLRAELAVHTSRPALLQAEADKAKLMLGLARILGYVEGVELVVTGGLADMAEPVSSDSIDRARLDGNPQVEKLDLELDALRATLEKAKAATLPSFSGSLSWSTSARKLFTAETWSGLTDSGSVSLGLNLPIDSWLPNSKADLARKRMEDNLRVQKLKRDAALRSLKDSLDQIASDLSLHEENMTLNRKAIDLSKKALEWTRQSWEQGRASIKDLEDAEEAMFNAEYALIANRYKYLSSLSDLAYLLENE
jgi:outer membrane protein TolC